MPYNSPSNTTGTTRPCLIVRPKPYDYAWEKTNSKGEELLNVFLELHKLYPTTEIEKWIPTNNKNYNWQNFIHPVAGSPLTVNDEDIMHSNLGISDEEIFTLYRTNAAVDVIGSGTLGTYGYNFPLIDAMNMKAYGLRELTFESRLIPASVDDLSQTYKARIGIDIIRGDRVQYAKAWGKALLKSTDKLFLGKQGKKDLQRYIEDNTQDELMNNAALRLIITEKRDRLWRWNRYNHLLESGMLTVKGRNAFVGQKMV